MDNKKAIIIGIVVLLLILWYSTTSTTPTGTDLTPEQRKRVMAKVKDLWASLIKYYAGLYKLPEKRVAAIIAQESGGNLNARGAAGEVGLMQLTAGAIAETDKRLNLKQTIIDTQVSKSFSWTDFLFGNSYSKYEVNLFEAKTNIQYGCAYLSILLDQYGNLDAATKRYNGTGTAADDYLRSVKEYEAFY